MTDLEVLIREYGVAVLCEGKENLPRQIKRILEAARATAEQRDSVIEECAKACEAWSADVDLKNKRNRVVTAAMTGALSCAAAIRALKSQQDAATQRSGDGESS